MTALAALHRARQAWEATQPQLTISGWADALDEREVERADAASAAASRSSSAPSEGTTAPGLPSPPEGNRDGSGALDSIERPGSDSPQGSVLPGLGGEG